MIITSGTRLGRYEIRSKIGAGGMGEVYLAEDTQLGRRVAIKLLPTETISDEHARRRLVREARSAATLDHPNICAIHEVGEEDGRNFICMQYVEGETLDIKIKGKSLDLSESLSIAAQVADALAEAHAHGIIHRDIKPANIIITPRGQAKVMDFGLAKTLAADAIDTEAATQSLLTTPGAIVGTVPYMSPEQVKGERVDARSDIFGFGVVLYEMLSRQQPFASTNLAETASAILTREPEPLARFVPQIPPELERIVRKCLEKDRDHRYQTVKDLSLDLNRLLKERESASTPIAQIALKPQRNLRRYALAVITLMFLAAVSIGVYRVLRPRKSITSVAVLPFININADPETEYLSDGITDSIIDRLSQLPNLKVMAHTAVFHYKGKQTDALTIGRELGVEAVLSGRVLKHNDTLTINLELADARDNSHIWGEQYERKISDLLVLQRELPIDISEKLRLKLGSESKERLTQTPTTNPEAYQLYLKGRYSWEKWTEDGSKQAVEYFEEAIKRDPNYAAAYAGLSDAYLFSAGVAGLSQKETHQRARAAAMKALELDPMLGEAHAALAEVLLYDDWDFASAERELKRAIELNPNYAEAHHQYSHLLLTLGRIDESLPESKKFLELDPISDSPIGHLGYHFWSARQYDEAIPYLQKAIQLNPSSYTNLNILADVYFQKGMFSEMVATYLKVLSLYGLAPEKIAALRDAFTKSGLRGYYTKRIELFKQTPETSAAIARAYARLGEKELAFEWLERAYTERDDGLLRLKEDPSYDNLRSDPRCADLLRRVGLPQ